MYVVTLGTLLAASFPPAHAVTDPADVIVYADHQPAQTLGGEPFQNPFTDPAGDPNATRIVLEQSPGIRMPLGTDPYGNAAWSKYVLVGNFYETYNPIFQSVSDQRFGVFNSETKQFCDFDLDPLYTPNASVFDFAVADPQARKTRIYYVGYSADPHGSPFGYVSPDLDNNDNPCGGGWPVTRFLATDLNAAAPPGAPEPCPGDYCGLDHMSLINHAADADTIVLANWVSSRLIVLKVSYPAGTLSVVDVYDLGDWKPDGFGGACFLRRPVGRAGIDPTRPPTDRRWVEAFDNDLKAPPSPAPQDGCAWVGLCPDTGASCTLGDSNACAAHCRGFKGLTCTDDSQCVIGPFQGGPCVHDCEPAHPALVCSQTSPIQHCLLSSNCPHFANGELCVGSRPTKPVQEFSLDTTLPGAHVTTTSRIFLPANSAGFYGTAEFDPSGALWEGTVGTMNDGQDVQRDPIIYVKNGSGEHDYFAPGDPFGNAVVPPYQVVQLSDSGVLAGPNDYVRVGSYMYLLQSGLLRRAAAPYGFWVQASNYKLLLGRPTLPSEAVAGTCGGSAEPCASASDCPTGQLCSPIYPLGTFCGGTQAACSPENPCPSGQICTANAGPQLSLTAGGSPLSLWMEPGFRSASNHPIDLYVERVPLATSLPDGISAVRPGVVWSGDRMWLVAEHDGALKFRVRDDGFWSSWYPVPGAAGLAGGAAVISNGVNGYTWLEMFVRGGIDGRIYNTALTSPLNCAPASCAWKPSWSQVPGTPSITTAVEPAAAYQGSNNSFLVVTSTSSTLYFTRRNLAGNWTGTWTPIPGITTDKSPAVAWHPGEGRFWVAARDSSSGRIRVTRITPTAPDGAPTPWEDIGTLSWATAPAIEYDGARMRVFAAQSTYQFVQQAIHDGSGWGSWRTLSSTGISTRQPVTANVNGDVNVFTYWLLFGSTFGIQEQAME
jgi:hypothetical protein